MMQILQSLIFTTILFLPSTAHTTFIHPLFAYETNSLTDESLLSLLRTKDATQTAHLFSFGSGAPLNPDRLKSGACKVFPGDEAWPSPPIWDSFDNLLDGALIKTVPLAAVCYQNLGVYDAEKCAAVQEGFMNQYTQYVFPASC